jgi:glucokinase
MTRQPEPTFIGIEIGGTKLQLVSGDDSARILRRVRFNVDRVAGGAGICLQIESGLAELAVNGAAGVGVGFGGPVDVGAGRICRSHQIDGWENFALRDWLRQRLKIPVTLENDANTAALGESHSGAGRDFNTVFYANFGSGVGGGIVSRRSVFHGAPPGEAEFGHLRLDRNGATVESRCSGWAVDARIRELVASANSKSPLRTLIADSHGGEAKHLRAALSAGDVIARRVLDDVTADIGFALSHAVHLIHPDVIVLGGGLSLIGEPFRAAVETALKPWIMNAFQPGPRVALAELGEDAVPVGALHLAIRAARGSMEARQHGK